MSCFPRLVIPNGTAYFDKVFGTLESSRKGHNRPITALAFLHDRLVVSGDRRGWVAVWDGFGCRWRRRFSRRGITALASGHGGVLWIGSFDRRVWFRYANELPVSVPVRIRRGVSSLVPLSAGMRVAVTSFAGELAVASDEEEVLREPRTTARGMVRARRATDPQYLLVWGLRGEVELRTAGSLEVVSTLNLDTLLVRDVMPLDGGMVAVLDYQHRVTVWLVDGWIPLGSGVLGLEGALGILGRIGSRLLLWSHHGILSWDLQDRGPADSWPHPGLSSAALDAAHGRLSLGFRDGTVQVWDLTESWITKN